GQRPCLAAGAMGPARARRARGWIPRRRHHRYDGRQGCVCARGPLLPALDRVGPARRQPTPRPARRTRPRGLRERARVRRRRIPPGGALGHTAWGTVDLVDAPAGGPARIRRDHRHSPRRGLDNRVHLAPVGIALTLWTVGLVLCRAYCWD